MIRDSTSRESGQRILLLISPSTIEQMLEKGNVWYVRHYEAYFDRVYVAYTFGGPHEPVADGNTTLFSLSTRRGHKIDLVSAPYQIYMLARRIRPTSYLTADLVYSWWMCLLARTLLGAKIFLMPVCMPEQIYKSTGKSMSGLPLWLERMFLKLSFLFSYRVLTGRNISTFINWLSSTSLTRHKLVIIDTLVEELPSIEFYKCLGDEVTPSHPEDGFNILYVGRLHKEKMVKDLIGMLRLIQEKGLRARLRIVGDGPERQNLEELATNIGVREKIDFIGSRPSEDLVDYYKHADVFVSPLTGTSLREAALCGTAVVAYDIDWVRGFLVGEENALLAKAGNVEELAQQVVRVLTDRQLRYKIARNLQKLALEYWRPEKVRIALKQAFGP
jgi:glycosyltransferase involved in cell wall biosynthesis